MLASQMLKPSLNSDVSEVTLRVIFILSLSGFLESQVLQCVEHTALQPE